LTNTGPNGPQRRATDLGGVAAYLAFVLLGGVLVFGFAWALLPAIAAQNAAPCAPLEPDARSGPAPDFEVQDLQGNVVRSQDLRGKFLVVNFWATWCEPCITEWPEIDKLAQRLVGRDDVLVLAISVDQERPEVPAFLEKMALTDTPVHVLWDPEQKLHGRFGTSKLPDTYFVSPGGELLDAFVNVRRWGSPGALRCVDMAIRNADE